MIPDRRPRLESEYIPSDIWLEILSRLAFKDLLMCQSVCTSWKRIANFVKKKNRTLSLCALLLRDTCFEEASEDCYICSCFMETEITSMGTNSSNNFVFSSGFGRGLLANLCFDFRAISDLRAYEFFAVHRGLILVGHEDGTYHVHNPATRQVVALPKSPRVQLYGARNKRERSGFIINLSPVPVLRYFPFYVLRLSGGVVELYSSHRRKWRASRFTLDDELQTACWSWENYVYIRKTRTLFFLTDKEQGVAVGCDNSGGREVSVYAFPLPEVVQGGFRNARLGECGGCLHLSYYNAAGGLWFWKHGGHGSSADMWVPLLKISKVARLSKSLASEYLFKVLNAGDLVIPIGFHPDVAIVFLYIKSFIFAYDLTSDTLEKIVQIDDQVYKASTIALPYSPCLSPLGGVKRARKGEKERKLDILCCTYNLNEFS